MIKKILPYLSNYKKYVLLCPLMIIGEVLLEITIPVLMAKIIDIGIKNSDMTYILKTGALMILMAFISLLFGALAGKFAAIASVGSAKELRKALFEKLQEFSFSNIDKFNTASLVSRLTTDVTNTQNAFMMGIRLLVRAPVMLVSATIMAFSINSKLVSVFLVAIPILATALGVIIKFAFPCFQAMLKKYDKMNGSVQENLVAIRVVKAFVRSEYEKEKFKRSTEELMNATIRAERKIIWNMPIMQFVMYACIIAIVWFGGNMVISGTMHTGQLMSFISYVGQILISLMMISMVFVNLVLAKASVGRIVEILDEEIDITDAHSEEQFEVKDGSIVFDRVFFSYGKESENNVLEDINLTIHTGETVGIIGGTGSAKTTLVQLIPRLYDPSEGKVIVGGHDVKQYKLETLRDAVSMVLQNNVLFSGTIKENLRWGDLRATDEQIIEACKAAQAHDFIMSFPKGYDTDLGQGGVNVSGGQKQRLCIARALLKKPKVLILDDSTSAVDTATDSKIREALKEKLTDTTTIIIAQRINSVCEADKIIVLNEGIIDAIGTHQELLQNSEIYKEVYDSQQKGADEQ